MNVASLRMAVLLLVFSTSLMNAAEPIRWGADKEGGAPYVFPPDDNPTALTGFEVDLAQALGRTLGTEMQFRQCRWDSILLNLQRGDIEVALNGYEYTLDRVRDQAATVPYYIYELNLVVLKTNTSLTGWDALRKPRPRGGKWTIGVLGTSAADRYCSQEFRDHALIRQYDGTTEAFLDVVHGRLDATVQDRPAVHYYIEGGRQFRELKAVDTPAAPGFYVMYLRHRDGALAQKLNGAIATLYESGELQRIYERYGIWNTTQTYLPIAWGKWPPKGDQSAQEMLNLKHGQESDVAPRRTPEADDPDKWRVVGRQFWPLVRAAGNTVLLAVLAMPLAILIGLIAALARTWHTPALGGSGRSAAGISAIPNLIFTVYVEVVRGTPLAFQLFVIYFVLPNLGDWAAIDAFWAGVIALAVNYSAYEAEIIRLGLQAIPRGQMEAALALGMSRSLAIRRIILPQAVRLVIPATANDFIALFKDTAVCSVIAVPELAQQYSAGAKSTGYYLEIAALASLLYLAMSYPLSLLAGWLERTLRKGH